MRPMRLTEDDQGPVQPRDDLRAENGRLRTRTEALEAVLGYREAELLELKGACSNATCRLHYAHSGPCDIRALLDAAPAGGAEDA